MAWLWLRKGRPVTDPMAWTTWRHMPKGPMRDRALAYFRDDPRVKNAKGFCIFLGIAGFGLYVATVLFSLLFPFESWIGEFAVRFINNFVFIFTAILLPRSVYLRRTREAERDSVLSLRRTLCPECSYDLGEPGSTLTICPECGLKLNQDEVNA